MWAPSPGGARVLGHGFFRPRFSCLSCIKSPISPADRCNWFMLIGMKGGFGEVMLGINFQDLLANLPPAQVHEHQRFHEFQNKSKISLIYATLKITTLENTITHKVCKSQNQSHAAMKGPSWRYVGCHSSPRLFGGGIVPRSSRMCSSTVD